MSTLNQTYGITTTGSGSSLTNGWYTGFSNAQGKVQVTSVSQSQVTGIHTPSIYQTYTNTDHGTFRVHTDAEFSGDVRIKGTNLSERLDKIEQMLGILRPKQELEDKWAELKALGDRYRELEKDILDKQSILDILKK